MLETTTRKDYYVGLVMQNVWKTPEQRNKHYWIPDEKEDTVRNGVIAAILHSFAEFDRLGGRLRHNG